MVGKAEVGPKRPLTLPPEPSQERDGDSKRDKDRKRQRESVTKIERDKERYKGKMKDKKTKKITTQETVKLVLAAERKVAEIERDTETKR